MFMHIQKFYEKTDELHKIISLLDFKPNKFGEELLNFNLISPGIEDGFSSILNQKIKLNKEASGCFRKPNQSVHFEDFGPETLWVGLVALEDTIFKTHKHKETGSAHIFSAAETQEKAQEFINSNCTDESKWDAVATVNLMAGDLILVKPWMWHSLDNKLVKVFYLESTIDADKV